MKQRLLCRDKVRKLLQALLQEQDTERFTAIVKQEPFPPTMPLSWALGERLSGIYYATLTEIIRELAPHHASHADIAQAFWELTGEVVANATDYGIRGRITKRLDEFTEKWKKPLKFYEVAYRIENLNLGTGDFPFGPVRFFTMDDAELIRWGISKDDPLQSHLFEDFANRPVAIVEVQAADNTRAFETGIQPVLVGLDLLRLAGVRSRISRLDDEMFLWKLDGTWLARQVADINLPVTWGWSRPFRPLIIDMREHVRQGLDPEYSGLLAIANGELQEEITSHLKRAIRWMSHSVTLEHPDDKIVDLCTALETMLLPGYEGGKKGQMIDLRHRLIGGNWVPGGILQLYELRSKIVHGSAINVSRYLDYWHLLHMCFEALNLIVNHAKRKPEVQTLDDLIKTIETKESLEDFVELFEKRVFKGKLAIQVKKAAKQRLKDLRKG